jgi:methyl coenzyme M reductase gamma subunit
LAVKNARSDCDGQVKEAVEDGQAAQRGTRRFPGNPYPRIDPPIRTTVYGKLIVLDVVQAIGGARQ